LQAEKDGAIFVEAVTDSFLTQHVKEATRGNNILDLVFSSEPDMVEDLLIDCPVSNSDHNVLRWTLICSVVKEDSEVKKLNYHKVKL
jgi:hypothetical protein